MLFFLINLKIIGALFGNIVILQSNYYLGKANYSILILGVRGVHKRIIQESFEQSFLLRVMYFRLMEVL